MSKQAVAGGAGLLLAALALFLFWPRETRAATKPASNTPIVMIWQPGDVIEAAGYRYKILAVQRGRYLVLDIATNSQVIVEQSTLQSLAARKVN